MIAILVVVFLVSSISAECLGSEKLALFSLFNSTTGDSWSNTTGWNVGTYDCCSWTGVNCLNGSVTELRLSNNGLRGSIPTTLFEGLPNLVSLDLSLNLLRGTLPLSVLNCTSLTTVILNNNQITGPIDFLFNSTTLQRVDIYNNKFLGGLPAKLPGGLQSLVLRFNRLTGTIPKTWNGTAIKNLDLSFNFLQGTIPDTLGTFRNLTWLDLSGNSFKGKIPVALGPVINSWKGFKEIGVNSTCHSDDYTVWHINGFGAADTTQYPLRLTVYPRCTKMLPQFGEEFIAASQPGSNSTVILTAH